jgi:hypothetical protein
MAAVLAGLGISAFGCGLIPSDLTPLPLSANLPKLKHAEFVLDQRPDCADPVVMRFWKHSANRRTDDSAAPRRRTSFLKSN